MKILNITIIAFLLTYSLKAQIFEKATISKQLVIGVHSAGFIFKGNNPHTLKKDFITQIYTEPYIGYFFNKNFGVGIVGAYEFQRTNMQDISEYDIYEIGGFSRFYFPVKIKKILLEHALFFSEISFRKTNYQKTNQEEYIYSNTLSYSLLAITPIGTELKLWKGLYGELSSEWLFYSKNYNRLGFRIGLEYHFNSKNNEK